MRAPPVSESGQFGRKPCDAGAGEEERRNLPRRFVSVVAVEPVAAVAGVADGCRGLFPDAVEGCGGGVLVDVRLCRQSPIHVRCISIRLGTDPLTMRPSDYSPARPPAQHEARVAQASVVLRVGTGLGPIPRADGGARSRAHATGFVSDSSAEASACSGIVSVMSSVVSASPAMTAVAGETASGHGRECRGVTLTRDDTPARHGTSAEGVAVA